MGCLNVEKKEMKETRTLLGAKTLRKQFESKLDETTHEFKKCKSWRADLFIPTSMTEWWTTLI